VSDPTPSNDWSAVAARRRVGELLLVAGVISEPELEHALAAQMATIGSRRRLGHVLVDLGMTTERQIAEVLGRQLGLQVVDLGHTPVSPQVARMLPRPVAARLGVLVLALVNGRVTLAVSDPTDVVAFDDVRLHTGASEIEVVVATESQIRDHLTRAWSLSADSGEEIGLFEQLETLDRDADPADAVDDVPMVRLVQRVLSDAVRSGASDVHLEPQRSSVRIRYRVDGVLREVMTLPRGALASLASRIKIVSGLDIAERRLPQDGRLQIHVDDGSVDARVSTMPSIHGEKVVVRLLSRAEDVPSLEELGLEPEQLGALRRSLSDPDGLILITGPTGVGKTNTLYSALHELNQVDRNIVTLEDPVEIQVPGITQIQVHERAGLTFSRGLRAILRQDPDIVLVGEVRDQETAELAVKASLTGHLVLTTLHTNSAVAAITRLVDMGVEPFLVGSSLTSLVAQRLVRRPCDHCSEPDTPTQALLDTLGVDRAVLDGATPRRSHGCGECGQTGYKGRTGVFEVLTVDADLRRAIATSPTEAAILEQAGPLMSVRDSAIVKALRGETTFAEAVRVSPLP
jgi:type II secretory ATPase GspE/PulE/Tfp pilus assembly ATPase PilB-like protein